MTSIDGSGQRGDAMERRARARARARVAELQAFYIHLAVYVGVNALLFAIDGFGNGSLEWAFWPAFAWGVALLVHYLIVRSIHVEDAWVEERAADLRVNSYDFDHIHNIKDRFGEGELDRAPSQSDRAEDR